MKIEDRLPYTHSLEGAGVADNGMNVCLQDLRNLGVAQKAPRCKSQRFWQAVHKVRLEYMLTPFPFFRRS